MSFHGPTRAERGSFLDAKVLKLLNVRVSNMLKVAGDLEPTNNIAVPAIQARA